MEKLRAAIINKEGDPYFDIPIFVQAIRQQIKRNNGQIAYELIWEDAYGNIINKTWECKEIIQLLPELLKKDNQKEIDLQSTIEHHLLCKYKGFYYFGLLEATEYLIFNCKKQLKPKLGELIDNSNINSLNFFKNFKLKSEGNLIKFKLCKIRHVCKLWDFFIINQDKNENEMMNNEFKEKVEKPKTKKVNKFEEERRRVQNIYKRDCTLLENYRSFVEKNSNISQLKDEKEVIEMSQLIEQQNNVDLNLMISEDNEEKSVRILHHFKQKNGEVTFYFINDNQQCHLMKQTLLELGYSELIKEYEAKHPELLQLEEKGQKITEKIEEEIKE